MSGAISTVDEQRGIVYPAGRRARPTTAVGSDRPGDNLLWQLDSSRLDRQDRQVPVWHFQTIHHDIWDFDIAGPRPC